MLLSAHHVTFGLVIAARLLSPLPQHGYEAQMSTNEAIKETTQLLS